MYFYLNEHCFYVHSLNNGAIYDLKKRELYRLDSEENQCLLKSEQRKEVEKNKFLVELVEQGLGFFSKEKCFVDKVRPYSPYLLSRRDLSPIHVKTAFIKLNDYCRADCDFCGDNFCPVCYCNKDVAKKSLSAMAWKNVLARLMEDFSLQEIFLTGGDIFDYEEIDELIDYITDQKVSLNILLTGDLNVLDKLDKDIHIIVVAYNRELEDEELCEIHHFDKATILIHEERKEEAWISHLAPHIRLKKISKEFHVESEKDLIKVSKNLFFMRRDGDQCLSNKVYFECNGDVIPCFQGRRTIVGNVKKQSIDSLLMKLVKDHWSEPVTKEKCKACALYYSCPSCKYFNTSDCSYDPQEGQFELEL